GGYLTFVYAAMQFIFSPTIGNLSDRFGRRPVLLISLAALAIDYLIMGFASTLWMLFLGRFLAGIAGATHSAAYAFMADISTREKRAQSFGLIGAAFGVGFILGPILGGIAGEFGTRMPFFVAATIVAANFLLGWLVLPESLNHGTRRPFYWRRANPFGAARQIAKFPRVLWIFVASLLFNIAHFVYPAVWSFFAKEVFQWSAFEIGLSLSAVGVGFAIAQGWLIRWIIPRFGEENTAILGLVAGAASLTILSFTTQGWIVYLFIPLIALSAMITPAMSSIISKQIPDDAQGELQGVIASIVGVTIIISPLMMTQLFGYFTGQNAPVYFPGAPFLAAAILMAAALVPLKIGLKRIHSRVPW
ncbi:MAG: TCR/Tet family MFS transporter, partial [Fimbriimonadaceae bacterium]|nr:TCR/Tet family MFS transporter [Alphaproteobacteria bacterium]